MKFLFFCVVLALFGAVCAWEKEDHEIFDLVSELQAAEGKGTTFYSLLGVPSTATGTEISKAYRKKSIQLHPDKNSGVAGAHERYARLGVINAILKTKAGRERYDFFYKNGVPKWRGSGYYYSRYRPGIVTVTVFLALLTSVLQHFVQRMNHQRDTARLQALAQRARLAAWGPKLIPVEGERRVRVPLSGDVSPNEARSNEDTRSRKMVDAVVDGDGSVYAVENGEEHLLDEHTIPLPIFSDTWAISLVRSLLQPVLSRFGSPKEIVQAPVPNSETATDDSSTDAKAEKTSLGGKKKKSLKRR